MIGDPIISRFTIGFHAPVDKNNRYYNRELGGGASKDITVYGYELTDYILSTFETSVDEKMIIYGSNGKIILPNPHFASECFLYSGDGCLKEHFRDSITKGGFTYEIEETMRCIKSELLESPVVPHRVTLECAELFDRIDATQNAFVRKK